jgi:hypothetical protein
LEFFRSLPAVRFAVQASLGQKGNAANHKPLTVFTPLVIILMSGTIISDSAQKIND